ncbi:sugar phosphate isomerase/epimerase family protein [Candidatus Pelagibacter sp. HIMB1509]|uniref:sugar phosphate isomerase/epimerase family protein n=1 Tax=Candidatus Pelagibacter sp. HIMB1509 TaxID=3413339 RepID=UPI003F8700E5
MKLTISNIAWKVEERKIIYPFLISKKIEGLEIAPKLFLHNHDNYLKPKKKKLINNLNEIKNFKYKIISMQSLFYNTEGCFLFGDNNQQEKFIIHFKKIIFLANKLKIPNLVFGSPKNKNIPKTMKKKDANLIAIKVFRLLSKEAKKYDITISLESNPKIYGSNFLNNINETYKLVKLINRKNIKLILDTGEILVNKNHNKINRIIKQTIKEINHVHLSEPYLKKIKNKLFFKKVISQLKKYNYKKWISIEMRGKNINNFNNIKQSISEIKKII